MRLSYVINRDVTEPAKIRIRRMRISCAKSVGCRCGFVARSQLLAIMATAIHLSYLQVAQLSQRDRAAGWVSNGKSGRLELRDNIYGQYRSIYSTTAPYLASKEIEIGEKTQNKGCYAV